MKTIIEEIIELKEQRNAAIIAHFYQIPEIQELADFVGDSLAMAKYGKKSDAEVLIICGVRFMAESAKILSPEKTILLPNDDAGCPMADMVTAEKLSDYKAQHPEKTIVSYVNTSAEVKALTDVCVTSSNALSIVEQLGDKDILFLPDRNLGGYINEQLDREPMDLWDGFCFTHDRLQVNDIDKAKTEHPDAPLLVHPECEASIVALADYVGSTSGIIQYAKASDATTLIIATEEGVMHRLKQDSPDKNFVLASPHLVCRNMKKTTVGDIYVSLNENLTEIELDETTRTQAFAALNTMLDLSK